jgi:LCP family protein required for cell wall assembly
MVKKTALLTILFVFILFGVTLVGIGLFAAQKIHQLANAAQSTPTELFNLAQAGWDEPLTQTDNKMNILILGVDQVSNRQGDPLLTDTMMLASINTSTAQINLLSLPRDLWLPDYQTKVNALYFYGQDRYPTEPQRFTSEVLSQLTQIPLHHTLVITLDQVANIIDLLGGIEVDVTTGFTDPEFPRTDVDIRVVTDPKLLYKSITFETGKQTMSGERALQFIRSRHSGDDQGTDQARGYRQQQVLEALLQKILSRNTLSDPQKVGTLLNYYRQNFDQSLPLTQLIALAKNLVLAKQTQNISLHKDNLSVQTATESGVITHPPIIETQNQWSYVIVDEAAFKNEVWQKLNLPQPQ